jgi:hypothetical protein
MKKIKPSKFFSLPFNYQILNDSNLFNKLIHTINLDSKKNKSIFDIYIGGKIPPFNIDAMNLSDDLNSLSEINFLKLQKFFKTIELNNIPLSLTFNNICISSSFENYKLFIDNLKKYIDNILTSFDVNLNFHFTIPFTIWLKFGFRDEIEKFLNKKILIKNTILWNLTDPAKIAKQFEEGFDYINVDRNLIRNIDLLKEIKEMKNILEKKLNKKLFLSLLINENCEGNCSIQNDHFSYNLNQKNQKFFESKEIRQNSCFYKDKLNPELYLLKTANLPFDIEEFNFYLNFIDVYKLHGRESVFVFNQSLDLILDYNDNKLKYDLRYKKILKNNYDNWKKFVRNCKFRCYKCDYCDILYEEYKNEIDDHLKNFKLF